MGTGCWQMKQKPEAEFKLESTTHSLPFGPSVSGEEGGSEPQELGGQGAPLPTSDLQLLAVCPWVFPHLSGRNQWFSYCVPWFSRTP